MDANILFTSFAAIASASGVWALIKYGHPNGHGAPAPPPVQTPAWPAEMMRMLQELPTQLERIAASARAPEPAPWPAEITGLPAQLERIAQELRERTPEVSAFPAELAELPRQIERIADQLQMPEPVWPAEILKLPAWFERITGQLEEIASNLPSQPPQSAQFTRPLPPAEGGGGGAAPSPHVAPPQPKAPDIMLTQFNSWTLAAGVVYTLIPPEPGVFAVNLLNLDASKQGLVYIRADADPAPGDPHSETLPAGNVTPRIPLPGTLRIVADISLSLTARLVHL